MVGSVADPQLTQLGSTVDAPDWSTETHPNEATLGAALDISNGAQPVGFQLDAMSKPPSLAA